MSNNQTANEILEIQGIKQIKINGIEISSYNKSKLWLKLPNGAIAVVGLSAGSNWVQFFSNRSETPSKTFCYSGSLEQLSIGSGDKSAFRTNAKKFKGEGKLLKL